MKCKPYLLAMTASKHVLLGLAFLLAGTHALPTQADQLAEAKAMGRVCEQADGYLRALPEDEGALQARISEENEKRKKRYQKQAAEQGTSVEEAGRAFANEILSKAGDLC